MRQQKPAWRAIVILVAVRQSNGMSILTGDASTEHSNLVMETSWPKKHVYNPARRFRPEGRSAQKRASGSI
jgi:hypothetical protein